MATGEEATVSGGGMIPAGPAVRRFAREVGINLENVHGTGPGGRITRDDVLRLLETDDFALRSTAMEIVTVHPEWGKGIEKVIKIAGDCLERPWPDLTIILDVDLETAAGRLDASLDRMEQKGPVYHEKVRQGFLQLAETRSDFRVVSAAADINTVHRQVTEAVATLS